MNQVSGACLKNCGTLMVTVLISIICCAVGHGAGLLHGNVTVIAEKKGTTIFFYFELALMKTGREVLLIEDGEHKKKNFFLTVRLCWVIT